MAEPNDLVRLLLIGDSGVGKSCLLLRFTENSFQSSFVTTIGIDFKTKVVNIDNRSVKLQIWDTAGQERFRTITSAYYRGAQGILMVYDITDERSFENIRHWVKNIEQHAAGNVDRILVGNKSDGEADRAVSTARGQALADEFGILFFETSAKDNKNVAEAFLGVGKKVLKRMAQADQAPPADPGVVTIGANGAGARKKAADKSKCCS
ncbi:unnamed protein product [Pedinophyceae sp. YPF-701]|nr:unnamed protein product [Pedinophyceae sp. YPF-701]